MKRKIAILAVASLVGLLPVLASAAGLQAIVPQSDCSGAGGCQSICDLATVATNVLDDGIYVAIFLSAILFAWAGWQLVVGSASGNTTQVHHAKNIFWYVIVGLVLILSAWIIVSVIMSVLTNNSNWSSLCGSQTTATTSSVDTIVGP